MPMLNIEQVAEELAVSKITIMREIKAHKLTALLIRGTYRIEQQAVEQYKADCQKAAEAGRFKSAPKKAERKAYTKRAKFDPMQRIVDPFRDCG